MAKILVTGATGYIGRRLTEQLLRTRPPRSIRILVRNRNKVKPSIRQQLEVVEGDTFDRRALGQALAGIDTAFYLIHSMGSGPDFELRDRQSAANFRAACIEAGVKRLIYLGGLGAKESASRHLQSRIETGEILSGILYEVNHTDDKGDAVPSGHLQTIWFRAGVIIGAGSASFEIIRNLVQKLPVMITPKWVKTRTQPIAVDDVLAYLGAAIELGIRNNLIIDIGAEEMSFRQMMQAAARVMGLRRMLIPVPLLTPRLSSLWLVLITPLPYQLAAALIEGLKSETLVLNDNAARYFPQITPRSYEQAIATALEELEQDQVISRWCDSSGGAVCDILGKDDPTDAVLRDRREVSLRGVSPDAVFESVLQLGGEQGWFAYDILWRIRGWIDKLLGGYGLNRGRRSGRDLRPGDALDFWKVADVRKNRRLLLLAQMKLPGKAWLEFDIRNDRLTQTAHFLPRGLWGRIYWYAVAPLHNLVFGNLATRIVARAANNRQSTPVSE